MNKTKEFRTLRKYLFIFLLSSMLFPMFPVLGPLSLDDIPSLIFVTFSIILILVTKKKLKLSGNKTILFLFLYALFSSFAPVFQANTFKEFVIMNLRSFFRPVVDILVIIMIQSLYSSETKEFWKDLFKGIIVATFLEFVFSLLSILTGFRYGIYDEYGNPIYSIGAAYLPYLGTSLPRLYGTMGANFLGGLMTFLIPITLFYGLFYDKKYKKISIIFALMQFLMLILTLTRGSYIALFIEGMLAILLLRKYATGILGLIFLTLTVFIFKPLYIRFFAMTPILTYTAKGMLMVRLGLISAALKVIFSNLTNFLFGIGSGNWLNYLSKNLEFKIIQIGANFMEINYNPHNNYIVIWVEKGILSLLCFLCAIFYILKYFYKKYKLEKNSFYFAPILGITGILMQGMTNDLFLIPSLMVYIWAISGGIGIESKKKINAKFLSLLPKEKFIKVLAISVLTAILTLFLNIKKIQFKQSCKIYLKHTQPKILPLISNVPLYTDVLPVKVYTKLSKWQITYLLLKETFKRNNIQHWEIKKIDLSNSYIVKVYSKKLEKAKGFILRLPQKIQETNETFKLLNDLNFLKFYDLPAPKIKKGSLKKMYIFAIFKSVYVFILVMLILILILHPKRRK